MKKLMGILILALTIAMNGNAGQKDTKKVEKVPDPKQVQQEREAIAEDCADLDRLSDLAMEYDELAAKGAQAGELNRVRTQIAKELRRGVDESKKQAKEAKKVAKQEAKKESKKAAAKAKGESSGKGKEGKADQAKAEKKAVQKQVKQKSKEAKAEVKEKQSEAKQAGEMLKKKRAVAVQLREVQRKMDAGDNSEAMQKKQAELLKQYGELSREEVKMGFRAMKKEQSKESPKDSQKKGKGSGKGE